ncbi:MAG TPA: sodium:proton antiporter [Pseudolabrys sp.]|nr:sodium:proton antiporter [Pseudolabrys sp.]
MVSFFDLFAMLLLLIAAFGWLNQMFLHLPSNIGLLLMGVIAALLVLVIDLLLPGTTVLDDLASILRKIDFYDAVMHGMLAFLLFAGALHVNWPRLRRRLVPVTTMATVGVVISTLVVGFGLWGLGIALDVRLPLPWALVFGALISPTDPVAVLSLLKQVRIPELLETEISGEALFNDGVGVVLFTMLVAVATASGGTQSLLGAIGLFLLEAVGGALVGLATGYIAFRAMRSIDEYVVEVCISLALVMVTYALADRLHMSGPIAVVVAGLLIGTRGPGDAMSETTQRYVFGFWSLVDELLNSVLFLLIGLELIVVGVNLRFGWLALAAIPLVLLARAVSVALPVLVLRKFVRFIRGSIPVLIWGGVRGGISVALALSLPYGEERSIILTVTYAVVLFTIVVQGLTMKRVIRRTVPSSRDAPEQPAQ